MASTLTRPRFTDTLRTLESNNSGSWQWNHWHSFAEHPSGGSFRTHRLSTSICHADRFVVHKRSETERMTRKERRRETNRRCYSFRRLFSCDRFLVVFDRTRVILSRSDNDTGDISDTVLTSLRGRSPRPLPLNPWVLRVRETHRSRTPGYSLAVAKHDRKMWFDSLLRFWRCSVAEKKNTKDGKRKYRGDSAIFHDTANNNGVLLLLTIIVKIAVIFPPQIKNMIKFQNDQGITEMYENGRNSTYVSRIWKLLLFVLSSCRTQTIGKKYRYNPYFEMESYIVVSTVPWWRMEQFFELGSSQKSLLRKPRSYRLASFSPAFPSLPSRRHLSKHPRNIPTFHSRDMYFHILNKIPNIKYLKQLE